MKLRFLTKKTIKGKQEYHLQSLEAHLALFNKMNKNFKHSLYNIHCNILYNGCPFDVFCLETQNTSISCRVPLHLANILYLNSVMQHVLGLVPNVHTVTIPYHISDKHKKNVFCTDFFFLPCLL